MKTVVFNQVNSKLYNNMESICLRVAYILSENVKSAGTSWEYIFFEEKYLKANFKQKLEVLMANYEVEDKEEWASVFKNALTVLKAASKIKYKSGPQFSAQKRTENLINKLYNEWVKSVTLRPLMQSFGELKKICADDILDFYPTSSISPEEEKQPNLTASKLLLRTLPGFEEDKGIFFLPPEFFDGENSERLNYFSSESPEAADVSNAYFEECFLFPDVNWITSSELTAVRSQLSAAHAAFNANMNEWIKFCSSSADTAKRMLYFKEKILSEAIVHQQFIQENEILKQCARLQSHGNLVKVLIGEIPVYTLWDYYRRYEVIKDETWDKLLDEVNNEHYKVRWPVMALKVEYANIQENIKNDFADDRLFVKEKKFISLD